MRQVPEKKNTPAFFSPSLKPCGIVGDGRAARHFTYYQSLLDIPVRQWSRNAEKTYGVSPEKALGACDIILILISDSEIENFIKNNPFLKDKILIHFSGAISTPYAESMHPIMTFGPVLYDLSFYEKIPFITVSGEMKFREAFPHLRNPSYEIAGELKPLYHSLCVMSGNFTTLLWSKFFTALEDIFKIPSKAARPYMKGIFKNLESESYKNALTGPISRKDYKTIEKNIKALSGDPFADIYEAFITAYTPEFYKNSTLNRNISPVSNEEGTQN